MSPPDGPSPRVSVVVPAFNAEATLGETVRSALAGSFADFELIVIDDGSTDGTAAIAETLAAEDRRVRLHRRGRNGGLSAALNSGFALARGDYIARLDADDLWHPDKLARQMALADAEPDLAFIYCWARYIDIEGRALSDGPPQHFPRWALCRGLYESLVGGGSSALMKRSAVLEAGGCDEALRSWEDLLLQLEISARHSIGNVPDFLVGYRVRPNSLSADRAAMLAGWQAVRRRLRERFPQVPRKVHAWAYARRCLELAESFAWKGSYARCAALLLQALHHDPQRTTLFLAWRGKRRLMRRLASDAPLQRLEQRRAAALARLDLSLRPRSATDGGSSPPAQAGS